MELLILGFLLFLGLLAVAPQAFLQIVMLLLWGSGVVSLLWSIVDGLIALLLR